MGGAGLSLCYTEKLFSTSIRQFQIIPDCGLKTRKWEEVKPSLENMIKAAQIVRKELKA